MKLIDMFPFFAKNNVADEPSADTETIGLGLLGCAIAAVAANLANNVFCQARILSPLSFASQVFGMALRPVPIAVLNVLRAARSISTLGNHIVFVIEISAKKQVIGAYTMPHVAGMTNKHTFGDRPIVQLIRKAVCAHQRTALNFDSAVTWLANAARPKPAVVGFLYSRPKASDHFSLRPKSIVHCVALSVIYFCYVDYNTIMVAAQ